MKEEIRNMMGEGTDTLNEDVPQEETGLDYLIGLVDSMIKDEKSRTDDNLEKLKAELFDLKQVFDNEEADENPTDTKEEKPSMVVSIGMMKKKGGGMK